MGGQGFGSLYKYLEKEICSTSHSVQDSSVCVPFLYSLCFFTTLMRFFCNFGKLGTQVLSHFYQDHDDAGALFRFSGGARIWAPV